MKNATKLANIYMYSAIGLVVVGTIVILNGPPFGAIIGLFVGMACGLKVLSPYLERLYQNDLEQKEAEETTKKLLMNDMENNDDETVLAQPWEDGQDHNEQVVALFLENHCLNSISIDNDKVYFYCDGFNMVEVLKVFPEMVETTFTTLSICPHENYLRLNYDVPEFDKFKNIKAMNQHFQSLNRGVYVFKLDAIIGEYDIYIYDDRYLHITTEIINQDALIKLMAHWYENIFNFSKETTENFIKLLIENNGKYILIGTQAEVLKKYDNIDEYWDDVLDNPNSFPWKI